jgi:8-oxo-dGTP diphosphatase
MNNCINLGSRAGAIVFHNNSLLLMYRQKNGKVYYVFPGGSIKSNESKEEAAIRELFEETSVVGDSAHLLYHLHIKDIPTGSKDVLGYKDEFLFLCNYISGNPNLGSDSEEYQRSSNKNFYEPMWVSVDHIKDILLYPLEVRDILVQNFKNDFKQEAIKLEVSNSKLRHL